MEEDVVLVLGDWMVDEHWVFGVHRSSTASRTGKQHLRALHDSQSVVQAFCGAGRSAYFLQQLYQKEKGQPSTTVLGLGFWHHRDTETLCSLFDSTASPNNLYRLTPYPPKGVPPGVDLINMNDALHYGEREEVRDRLEYTTRIIRVYRSESRGVVYDRLDWELRPPPAQWTSQKLVELARLLRERLKGRHVRAVVIKDMRKGALTRTLIQWLVREMPKDVHWYVSSKKWDLKWLNALQHVQLRLFMVPQVAANEAIRNKELSSWLARSGRPSREAIRILETIKDNTKAETILVLPDGLSALVFHSESGQCVFQPNPAPERIEIEMGGASILYPAMLACMEHERIEKLPLKDIVSTALKITSEWVNFEARRIHDAREWKPNHGSKENTAFVNLRNAFHNSSAQTAFVPEKFGNPTEGTWENENAEWTAAFTLPGVIPTKPEKELQLWRSMLEVEGYVCCDGNRRKLLRELLQGIQVFARSRRHHASCILIAGPGTGKSFLANKLARSAGLEFKEFNITQLRSKGDIVECFDTIASAQAKSDRPFLVFMDEINATLDGKPIYSAFLTPLEDGTYVSSGRTEKLEPCVWVFAGTERPKDASRDDTSPDGAHRSEKGSDFESRLSLSVFDLSTDSSLRMPDPNEPDPAKVIPELERLERIYLGVSLLKAEFSDIDHVSEAVLYAFATLPPKTKARDLKHFVRRFEDVQYGVAMKKNVPKNNWPGDEQQVFENYWRNKHFHDTPTIRIVGSRGE